MLHKNRLNNFQRLVFDISMDFISDIICRHFLKQYFIKTIPQIGPKQILFYNNNQ